MTAATCKIVLEDNLSESFRCAEALEALLDQERHALERQDTELLGETAAQKRQQVLKLDELDTDRRALCNEYDFGVTVDSIIKLVAWCDDSGTTQASWTQFIAVAERCGVKNSSNGAVIRVRQAQINDALGLLRNGTNDAKTYGPTGHGTGRDSARSLAEA